jgi:hypothetical protein
MPQRRLLQCPPIKRLGSLLLLWLVALGANAETTPAATGLDSAAQATLPKTTVLPIPPSTPVPSRATLVGLIDRTAKRYGVERDLVHAVVRAESGYNPHAVSPAGAVGLMQVMPATAADYGVGSVTALFDPQTNVRTGVRHLKRLLDKYGIGKAIMAYNAGEGALERADGFVTYAETQRYTHRVLTTYLGKKGVPPYSAKARAITGVTLTPAMASAGGAGRGRVVRHIDVSKLSLRVRPTLSMRALDPAAHSIGPDSEPMFVLEAPRN